MLDISGPLVGELMTVALLVIRSKLCMHPLNSEPSKSSRPSAENLAELIGKFLKVVLCTTEFFSPSTLKFKSLVSQVYL